MREGKYIMTVKTITDTKAFHRALNTLVKVTANTQQRIAAVMLFAVTQLQQHRNTSPLAAVVAALPAIGCKPRGLTVKAVKELAESNGLEWDGKKRVFKIDTNSDASKNGFADINATFWKDLPEPVKATPKTTAEKLAILLKDVDIDDALKMLETHYDAQFTIIDDDVTVELQAA
jgi:hypothetical protein